MMEALFLQSNRPETSDNSLEQTWVVDTILQEICTRNSAHRHIIRIYVIMIIINTGKVIFLIYVGIYISHSYLRNNEKY